MMLTNTLRNLIAACFVISLALGQEVGKREWTLAAQKVGYRLFGRSKDSSLSNIKISYNADGNNEFRLVNVLKGGNKRFYFSKEKHRSLKGQQAAVLNLTEEDLDKVNNCVTLRMKASPKLGRVCDRRIYYLDQDGPQFMQFLCENGKIAGLNRQDHFIRHTVRQGEDNVITYNVTVMKGDYTNKTLSAVVSNKMMQQTSQLRVHMNTDDTAKQSIYFELAEKLGNSDFTISKITTYDEENNRVLLTTREAESLLDKDWRGWKGVKNRWLYLGVNTDSKKFLLFLMEMYHNALTDNHTKVFSKATEASMPTVFQGRDQKAQEWQKVAGQYMEERRRHESENARKFERLLQQNEVAEPKTTRRRLTEVAYRSFIGFNMLLMCCLLIGISFAYVGTQDANHGPIRW